MPIESHNSPQCPDCGAAIPPGQPKGLCATCALKGALELSNGENQVLQTKDGANASPPQPVTPVGQLPTLKYFGDYELLEEIARGGMGVVYKARQASLDRVVAVKLLLRGEYAGEDFIKRFRIEASAAASLQHPNIVAIHEVGVHEGHHYFAMDLVDGPNLAQLLCDGPLSAKRAAGYVKVIADAIHFAHTRQILHRDLKPSNVLIDSNDQPRVTDFGLAKRFTDSQLSTQDASQLTLSGHVLGSPAYMPPEQASGERDKVGVTSDVYSLGAILYHALTGRPPFAGQSVADTLKQVEDTEPIAPRLLNPSVPRDLETICLKCLQKEPGKRYSSAQELTRELGRFLCDEPIHAHPVSGPEKLWRWCRRKPAIAGMAAGIALFASIGLAGWLVAKEKAAAAARAMEAKAKTDQDAARETQQAAEILRANREFLLQHAFKDTNNLRGPALLKALEDATTRQPTDLTLWQAKIEVLTRANRLEEALENFSRAIELASANNNLAQASHIELLLARSRLFRQMGRKNEADTDYSQASRINCQRKGIPARAPQTQPEMLDLGPFFQFRLPSWLDMLSTDGTAAVITIREDVKRDTGVEFDLRGGGLDVLGRRGNSPQPYQYLSRPPEFLNGVSVNRRFVRLHVLHSVWHSAAENMKIAAYVLHYADGQTREIPILYGKHVRDVWLRDRRPPMEALVAWQGESSGANKDCRGVQFFKTTWENPRPEIEVRTIDLELMSPDVYPILLGMTVERAEPGSLIFWSTIANELEEKGDFAEALNTHAQAIRQFPENPVLWDSKGRLLERTSRTNEALQAYTKAIEMAARDTNAFLKVLTAALFERSSLLNKMGRSDEAGIDNCRARRIPTRDPQTPAELLDLSRFYNASLGFFLPSRERESTDLLSRIAQQNTGVAFDARGIVILDGKGPERDGVGPTPRLQSFLGIPIRRRLTRLHIMQGASYRSREGTEIGHYLLHFADGQSETLPIVYGKDVSAEQGDRARTTRAKVAWPRSAKQLPIYQVTWTNPYPNVEIKSLDFVSAMSETSPMLIAITIE